MTLGTTPGMTLGMAGKSEADDRLREEPDARSGAISFSVSSFGVK